jgi:peptide/nickel transport system substrate-binding protein
MSDKGRRAGTRRSWFTRRQVVGAAVSGTVLYGAHGLLGIRTAPAATKGGVLSVGATGGGAKDHLDAHGPVGYPDIARAYALYEPLLNRNPNYEYELLLAEEISASPSADVWTIRLKQGIEFHNGKTVTADDAIFSIQRIIDPDNPKVGAAGLTDIDPQGFKKIDERTFLIQLKQPFAVFDEQLGQYFNGIVPVDYDPNNPVGTGPFRFGSFTPGEHSRFPANPNYWIEGEPHVDELVIIDFPDDTARVNALLSGQVQAIDNLPLGQLRAVEANPELKALVANTGAWLPFTMRVDQPPFDDVRVRQALRLIVDRQQMIDQALAGNGWVGNDLYSPFDPCYASDLPQREQDLEKAKALLKEAGHDNLVVELVTSPVAAGVVEAAQVFAEQAKGAGVTVNVRKVDTGVFYGDDYLKWPFAQDFWFTRDYIPQVAQGTLPSAPYNETHWADPAFIEIIDEARGTLDAGKRCELLRQAQQIEYDSGGYIVWGFRNQVDAYSARIDGFVPAKTGTPLGNYAFGKVYFV